MTINSGAMQETKPWTSFAKAADIPDWISKAYIESYRGPHGGEPEVPAASASVDAAVPAAFGDARPCSALNIALASAGRPAKAASAYYPAGDAGDVGPSLQLVTDHGGMLMDSVTVLLHRLGVGYTAIMAPVFEVHRSPNRGSAQHRAEKRPWHVGVPKASLGYTSSWFPPSTAKTSPRLNGCYQRS